MKVKYPGKSQRIIMFGDCTIGTLIDIRNIDTESSFVDFIPSKMMEYVHQITRDDFNKELDYSCVSWVIPNSMIHTLFHAPSRSVTIVMGYVKENNLIEANIFSHALKNKSDECDALFQEKELFRKMRIRTLTESKAFIEDPTLYKNKVMNDYKDLITTPSKSDSDENEVGE